MQNPTERPAESLDSISPGLAVQERERQNALLTVRRLRKEASAEIERLIAFMDETDGYTLDEMERDDAEPTVEESRRAGLLYDNPEDGEPSLGWPIGAPGQQFPSGGRYECDAELDNCDDEPSLGSVASLAHNNQSHWAQNKGLDLEDEHDGAEPDDDAEGDKADDEPSLGWTVDGVTAGFDDREDGAGPDVRAARERNHRGSENPGAVSIDTSRGYITQITGLTARQKNLLGTEWLRR